MRCSAIRRCIRARSVRPLLGPSKTFSNSCLALANFCWWKRASASSYVLSCACTSGSTSSTPPRCAGGGGGKFFFFSELEWLCAVPLPCPDEPEEALRAFAMWRIVAEENDGVNECPFRAAFEVAQLEPPSPDLPE